MKKVILISTVATSILLLSACGGQNKTADSSSQTSITATSKSGSEAQSSTQQSVTTEASSSVAQPGPSETQNTESNATLPVPGEANLTTSEEAQEYLLKQLGYENNDDLYLQKIDNNAEDGNYHFGLYSKSLKENGGSGTVDTYTIAKNGLYSQGNVLGNSQ